MADSQCGLTVIKRMQYRGNANEEFSNSYWFTGAKPADSAAWRTFFDAFVLFERAVYPSFVSVIAGYGYDSIAADAHAVWSVDLTLPPNSTVPGTLPITGANVNAGDSAVWVRWGLDKRTSKGKPIYLRKYFHPGMSATAGTVDAVLPGQKSALETFGTTLMGAGVTGRKICDDTGEIPINYAASSYITTRTLKRRGKRPPT